MGKRGKMQSFSSKMAVFILFCPENHPKQPLFERGYFLFNFAKRPILYTPDALSKACV
jgi:hypothetical protein